MSPRSSVRRQPSRHDTTCCPQRARWAAPQQRHWQKSTSLLIALFTGISGQLACSDGVQGPTSPTSVSAGAGVAAIASGEISGTAATLPASAIGPEQRRGDLLIEKECSEFSGLPGSFCTITASNVKAIEVGSRIIYADPSGPMLDTDIVLDLPGPGNNRAFGHCILDPATGSGECTLSGGTGKFKGLMARADVSYLGGPDWRWEGTFSFSPFH